MVRETGIQSQVEMNQRPKKLYFDAVLHTPQHYKVMIKGKVEQSWE